MPNPRNNHIILCLIMTIIIGLNHNTDVNAYKIVMTTIEVGSHILTKIHLGQALVESGHEVYLVVSERMPNKQAIWRAGIKTLEYSASADSIHYEFDETKMHLSEYIKNKEHPVELNIFGAEIFYKNCEDMMNDKKMLENIRDLDADMFIVEPFIICPCNTILPVYLGKPFVSIAMHYMYLQIRTPALPSFVVPFAPPITSDNLHKYGLIEKLEGLYYHAVFLNLIWLYKEHKTDMLIKYAPQFQTWPELARQSQLFLLEIDHHLGGFVPWMPNFVNIAGHTITPTQPLTPELQALMDSAADGVVVVSFGTVAYYFPKDIMDKLFKAFSSINQTVVARLPIPQNGPNPSNVKLMKWFPQNDLLAHKNTRLFITHCGNNGQYEALHFGIPMIAVPLFAEQHINAKRTEEREYGVEMDIHTFTADQLVKKIHEVIYNDKYKKAIGKASQYWRDHFYREPPLDRAVFWIEHVIKYGGKHLRSPSLDQSLFEFLMVDILLVVLLAMAIAVCFFLWVFYQVYKCCKGRHTRSNEIKKFNGSKANGITNNNVKNKHI